MKLRNIILLAIITIQCIACESFLDIKPVGKAIPTTYSEYKALLSGGYSTQYDRSYSALLSDEASFTSTNIYYKDIYIWNTKSPDQSTQATPWVELYKSIFYANHVIKNRNDIKNGTKEAIEQLVGEAFIMRAYMHFNLANLYANQYGVADPATQKGIPIEISTAIDVNKFPKRNTLKEVYDQVVNDIEDGIKLLNINEFEKGENFRFSKVSAFGFAARVYLSMGNYEKAKEYAQKALDLNSKLEDLNSSTAIMPYKYKSVENVLAFENTFKFPYDLAVSPKLLGLYNLDNDLRIKAYYTLSNGIYKIKLGGSSVENKVSMRTSEFYLIKAESIARSNGNLDDAKAALKELLKNRLKPDYYTQRAAEINAMDKSAFIQAVFDERARELAFQGFRWFDLKRNGKPKLIKEYKGVTYTLEENDPRYIVRIPKDAVTNNPNLAE